MNSYRTAIEQKYEENRLIAIADVLRQLLGEPSGIMSPAINLIINKFPTAAQYIPLGSRPGEARPASKAKFEYREGMVYYWRPSNRGDADASWSVR